MGLSLSREQFHNWLANGQSPCRYGVNTPCGPIHSAIDIARHKYVCIFTTGENLVADQNDGIFLSPDLTMLSLAFFLLAVGVVALGASRFQPDAWHERLIKPSWNPPNWVFPPVWSILYLLIAIAGWFIWLKTDRPLDPALVMWLFQLTLNGFWTYLFFGRRRPDLALVDIVVLLIMIILFIVSAIPTSPLAAFLFVPYFLWIAFAAVLNFRIWQLNRMR